MKKSSNIFAYPHYWQRPAKTEEWAYESLVSGAVNTKYAQWVCFPWATLIDLLNKNMYSQAKKFEKALCLAPPRSALLRATVCQHIDAKKMLPWFHKLKITDLFWSHATINEPIIEGIRIHPFPLYPVQAVNNEKIEVLSNQEKIWLYNYIGAYQPGLYLTNTRNWIVKYLKSSNAYIKERSSWHYETAVYEEQIKKNKISVEASSDIFSKEKEYQKVMSQSIFALCPSGAGPNSIRLWEALGLGAIPIIISDSLRLPGDISEWQKACLFVNEEKNAIKEIPELLERIAKDRCELQSRKNACAHLWQSFIEKGPSTILGKLNDTSYVHSLVTSPSAVIG